MSRFPRLAFVLALLANAACALALGGCATQAAVSNEALPFDQAVDVAGSGLIQQTQELPAILGRLGRHGVVLDPSLDAGTGQQTAATQRMDRAISERLSRDSGQFEVLPFQAANLSRAHWLLMGTLTRSPAGFRLDLALLDLSKGTVVAQSSALARPSGVDMRPLAYYRDSPVMVKDKVVDGYVRTSSLPPGQPIDPAYLERIATAATLNDATVLYNTGRYREALGQYRSALATPAGEQIRVLNGIYLSQVKLGQTADAEESFGRLVAFGIATRNLGVKFLFNPGSTDFWSDPKVNGPYGMWLRQIARKGELAKVCMDVVGHTSHTGSEESNDPLSLKRALLIRQRLGAESPELAKRTRAQGMGSRQNIVGSGTDDIVDAPDRRVEFAIVDCAR